MYAELLCLYKSLHQYLTPKVAICRLLYYHWTPLLYFAIFTLIKYLVWSVQLITWRITGINRFLKATYSDSRLYERSAQVKLVIKAYKQSEFDKVRDNFHFITIHERFENPEFVLRDDVILVDVTYTKAIFLQLPKTLDHYTAKTHPFLFISLAFDTWKLIEMPLSSFHKLADSLGNPCDHYEKIFIMHHEGRCGSTLVFRMIAEACESDPDTMCICEPPTMLEVYSYKCNTDRRTYMKIMRSCMHLLLKPMLNKKKLYVKFLNFNTFLAEDMREVLPGAKYFFVYRDPLRFVWSIERAFGYAPVWTAFFAVIHSRVWPMIHRHLNVPRKPWVELAGLGLNATMFEACVLFYGDLWLAYKRQAKRFEFPAINYEDYFKDSAKFCKSVLELCELPLANLDKALSVADKDSQEGTLLGQHALRDIPVTQYTPELKKRTDYFCDICGVPRLDWTLSSTYRRN